MKDIKAYEEIDLEGGVAIHLPDEPLSFEGGFSTSLYRAAPKAGDRVAFLPKAFGLDC